MSEREGASRVKRHFASDNYAGAHPRVMEAVIRANSGHARAYGDDCHTERAVSLFRRELGDDVGVHFVLTGTAANVLSLRATLRPYEAAICSSIAHLNMDECAAPEAIAGVKLLLARHVDGKISPESIEPLLGGRGDVHRAQPRIVSITQATEYGTVYSLDELRSLSLFTRSRGLYLHMDGARIANAAAALGASLREITRDSGVDIVSFGGTKNGLLFGEAVLVMRPELNEAFGYVRKQSMQLASKMRFVSAQFEALLEDGLWLRNARAANGMAALLAERLRVAGIEVSRPVEANAVFVRLPESVAEAARREVFFYPWDTSGEYRLMTSFDTTEEDVNGLVSVLCGG